MDSEQDNWSVTGEGHMRLPAQISRGSGRGVIGEIGLISLPPKPCGKYEEKLYACVLKKTWINTNYCIHNKQHL